MATVNCLLGETPFEYTLSMRIKNFCFLKSFDDYHWTSYRFHETIEITLFCESYNG